MIWNNLSTQWLDDNWRRNHPVYVGSIQAIQPHVLCILFCICVCALCLRLFEWLFMAEWKLYRTCVTFTQSKERVDFFYIEKKKSQRVRCSRLYWGIDLFAIRIPFFSSSFFMLFSVHIFMYAAIWSMMLSTISIGTALLFWQMVEKPAKNKRYIAPYAEQSRKKERSNCW